MCAYNVVITFIESLYVIGDDNSVSVDGYLAFKHLLSVNGIITHLEHPLIDLMNSKVVINVILMDLATDQNSRSGCGECCLRWSSNFIYVLRKFCLRLQSTGASPRLSLTSSTYKASCYSLTNVGF